MSILVVLAAVTLASGLEFKEDLNVNSTEQIDPDKGDKIPPYAKTFPGCACTWGESRGQWSCEGRIAFPEDIQGEKCGCCGMKCLKSNRQTDDVCLAGGYDQQAEMAAERKRLAELLKGADMLLSDDLPGFIVTVPDKGQCTNDLLVKACKQGNANAKDLTPLCDHSSYYSTGKCYTPAGYPPSAQSKFNGRHMSHWSSHRQLMKFDVDDEIFYGMCFVTSNGAHTLYPTSTAHGWSSSGSVSPRAGLSKPKSAVPIAKMNDGSGELGMWRTICVRNPPTKSR